MDAHENKSRRNSIFCFYKDKKWFPICKEVNILLINIPPSQSKKSTWDFIWLLIHLNSYVYILNSIPYPQPNINFRRISISKYIYNFNKMKA